MDYAEDNITVNESITVDHKINATNTTLLNGTYYSVEKDTGVAKVQKVVTEKPKLPLITIISKPSCGCRNGYYWHKRSFVNYCPHCHHYNALYNKHKYQARYEQELTCNFCDSDFCGVCGKTKYSWSKTYLRRA